MCFSLLFFVFSYRLSSRRFLSLFLAGIFAPGFYSLSFSSSNDFFSYIHVPKNIIPEKKTKQGSREQAGRSVRRRPAAKAAAAATAAAAAAAAAAAEAAVRLLLQRPARWRCYAAKGYDRTQARQQCTRTQDGEKWSL